MAQNMKDEKENLCFMLDKKNRVYITATSSITCAGNNNEELFENICAGQSGITQTDVYASTRTVSIGIIKSEYTFYENLILKCQNILDNSNLENFENTLLIIGSSVGGMKTTEDVFFATNNYHNIDPNEHNIDTIANKLRQAFNFYDDISFSTACTSSANAIGYGYEVLSKGIYDNVLVVGADSLCQTTIHGFVSLGVLSSNPCKPFDKERDGMNVAEGIACLLLETIPSKHSIEICGVGYSSDAHHMTQPHSDGSKNAMLNCLKLANIQEHQIDYINAHGTGTIANDEAEGNSISSLFQHQPYVSSTKSITGHTLGASGALEAIISSMVILKQIIPKNSFLEIAQNENLNLVKETINTKVRYVLSNSFAFGGNNCSLLFGEIV